MPLRVVALTLGTLSATHLWTLKLIAEAGHDLRVVRARQPDPITKWKRFRRLVHDYGFLRALSRRVAHRLIGRPALAQQEVLMGSLLDYRELARWWDAANIPVIDVPWLTHDLGVERIAALEPDVMIRISGGVIPRRVFGLARMTTLNIHHGVAPAIRGVWSIPWGIVEARPDWIGATVHQIDDGINTGPVFWRGSPQIAPGDTGELLYFRAHLEASAALVRILDIYACGEKPVPLRSDGESVYRTAPGLAAWIRYRLLLRRGLRAPWVLEKALR
jgi:hypothetical protein